jgi:hypothetical protein
MPIINPPSASFPTSMGRLATVPKSGYTPQVIDQDSSIVIYLPQLPEDIELSRENQYDDNNTFATPDGLFVYKSTNPLEIPLSFSLHAYDDLCPQGPKTLLDIAAALQALQLPASGTFKNAKAASAQQSGNKAADSESTPTPSTNATPAIPDSPSFDLKFPPACSLRLIQAGQGGKGINCVGFVKRVAVKLHGPFLQTSDQANGFNLPSAITCDFVFVHSPLYTNNMQSLGGAQRPIIGPDVYAYFYNTAAVTAAAGLSYFDVGTGSGVTLTK